MGVLTDGQICFGIAFEEEFEFPWGEDRDVDDWWLEDVLNYKPPFEIYGEDGYLGGVKPPQEKISEYHKHRRDFIKTNPMQVEVVMHCSGDYPMYILAVMGTVKSARRGNPVSFDPADLKISNDDIVTLFEFCEKYGIDCIANPPKWWLSSLWH